MHRTVNTYTLGHVLCVCLYVMRWPALDTIDTIDTIDTVDTIDVITIHSFNSNAFSIHCVLAADWCPALKTSRGMHLDEDH